MIRDILKNNARKQFVCQLVFKYTFRTCFISYISTPTWVDKDKESCIDYKFIKRSDLSKIKSSVVRTEITDQYNSILCTELGNNLSS